MGALASTRYQKKWYGYIRALGKHFATSGSSDFNVFCSSPLRIIEHKSHTAIMPRLKTTGMYVELAFVLLGHFKHNECASGFL